MRAFVVKASDDGFWRVEEAVRAVGGENAKVRLSLFKGVNFPLTHPLPSRVDGSVQGYLGLGEYNVIALLDVDPGVFTPVEVANLIAYVENGGGLLITGGSHSLGNAFGTYTLLDPILPASVVKEAEVEVNGFPEVVKRHPSASGIPFEGLNRVSVIQKVVPKRDAEVVLKVSENPLLLVRGHGRGRVAMFATYPTIAPKSRDFTEKKGFFTAGFYDDLIRQVLLWLARRDEFAVFDRFTASSGQVVAGEAVKAETVLFSVKPMMVKVRFRLEREGKVLSMEEQSLKLEGAQALAFSLKTEKSPRSSGILQAVVEVLSEDGSFLNRRDWSVEVRNIIRVSLGIVSRKAVVAPGSILGLRLQPVSEEVSHPPALEVRVRIVDFRGCTVVEFAPLKSMLKDGKYEGLQLSYEVPNLAKGTYQILSEVAVDGEVKDVAGMDFKVVDPLDLEDFYPIVGEAWASFDEDMIKAWIDDTVAHGFNTVAFGGNAIKDYDWLRECDWDRLQNFAEAYAQEKGLAVAIDYSLLIDCHRHKPPDVCVNNPGFREAEAAIIMPQLATAARIPRLYTVETVDEPLVSWDSVCYCDYCKESFRKRYGVEMPVLARIRDYDVETRLKLYEWISGYWAEGFKTMYDLKRQSGFKFYLNHTFCLLSFGAFCPEHYYRDSFAWAPYCDILDFDIYPYMYPMWRGSDRLIFHAIHHHLSGHKALTRFYGKPMGFFVETTERNYPMYVPPVRASSEVAYTAIAHGANFLKTFINVPFTGPPSNNGPSQARWDVFGGDLRKIGLVSPLLTRLEKVRPRFAMLFAFTDWLLSHYHPKNMKRELWPKHMEDRPLNKAWPYEYNPWNVYEACFRAFGELEVIHEKFIYAGELSKYAALVLPSIKYIPDSVAQSILEFVSEGGTLIFDTVPTYNERGEESSPLAKLVGEQSVQLMDGLEARIGTYGKGRALFLGFDFNDVYSSAVESGDEGLMKHVEQLIRDFLFEGGLRPHAYSENPEVEVGVWEGGNTVLLVVVNHCSQRTETSLTMYSPLSFTPVYAYDVASMEEITFAVKNGDVKLSLSLSEREGRIIALYPDKVVNNRVSVDADEVRRGEELSYRVVVEASDGQPARGHHVVEVTVMDPEGIVHPRYGGRHSTTDGVYMRRVLMGLNELVGAWTITVYDRYTRRRSRIGFKVIE